MTEREYNQAEGIRRSVLWEMRKSPAHLKYKLEHASEPTPALIIGQALHCKLLTPENFDNEFVILPNVDKRTKEGREVLERVLAKGQGKTQITAKDMGTVIGMWESVMSNPTAVRLLDGMHETPYFWADDLTAELCKCRTDCETDIGEMHLIVDVKTCQDADDASFMRDALKYGYDVQAAMYRDGVKAVTNQDSLFVFIAVEKSAPYAVNILQMDEGFMAYGQDRYRELLGKYHECKKRDQWPGYTGFDGEIGEMTLPPWLKKEIEG